MKTSLRSEKKAKIIQQHIPFILQSFIDPDIHGFPTITHIQVSVDLLYADIYIQTKQEKTIEYLNRNAHQIAHELVQKFENRKKMILRFKRDTTDKLLEKIQ